MADPGPVPLVEIWRGDLVESRHRGHVVVSDGEGIVASWGEPGAIIYPRSSCKMIQALPLVESGAAEAAGIGDAELALACASHEGGAIHVDRVRRWLAAIGRGEDDLLCGPQTPGDRAERARLRARGVPPGPIHNNCSGKHAGFLTLAAHLGAGPAYIDPDHPVQRAVRGAFEAMTGETSPGFGIDGCSAPNFACSVAGLARAAALMARPDRLGGRRGAAAARLVAAMITHPELVAGEGRACTDLIRAGRGGFAVKTGAEGVFVAILPGRGLGIALKVEDGATRASETAITAILARLGMLDPGDPVVVGRLRPTLANRRGIAVGSIRPADALWQGGLAI